MNQQQAVSIDALELQVSRNINNLVAIVQRISDELRVVIAEKNRLREEIESLNQKNNVKK